MEFPEDLMNTVKKGDVLDIWQNVPDDSIDFIVSSPPYFNAREEYASWKTYQDYVNWLGLVMNQLGRVLKPGRRIAWNICDYALEEENGTFAAPISADSINCARNAGLKLRHWIIWADPAALARRHPTGTFPHGRSVVIKHSIEFVLIFQKPGDVPRKPIPAELELYSKMGKKFFTERVANQVWTIKRQTEDRENHPAPFPEPLVEPLIRMFSLPGDVVADPFMGSFTTAISAMLWKRNFFGSELKEEYWNYGMHRMKRREIAIRQKQHEFEEFARLEYNDYGKSIEKQLGMEGV